MKATYLSMIWCSSLLCISVAVPSPYRVFEQFGQHCRHSVESPIGFNDTTLTLTLTNRDPVVCDVDDWWSSVGHLFGRYMCLEVDGYSRSVDNNTFWGLSGQMLFSGTLAEWPTCTAAPQAIPECRGEGLQQWSQNPSIGQGTLQHWFVPAPWINATRFTFKVCQRGGTVTFTRHVHGDKEVVLHELRNYSGSYIENSIRSGPSDSPGVIYGNSTMRMEFRSSTAGITHNGVFINATLTPLEAPLMYCAVGYEDADVSCSGDADSLIFQACSPGGPENCVNEQGGSGYVECDRASSDSTWTYHIWYNQTGCPGVAPSITHGRGTQCTRVVAETMQVRIDCSGWQPGTPTWWVQSTNVTSPSTNTPMTSPEVSYPPPSLTLLCPGQTSSTSASTSSPRITARHGTVVVVSDGSATRPYCSWLYSCSWNGDTQRECARALCQASGYGFQGTFLSASNNPCTSSFVSGRYHFYLLDRDYVDYGSYTNDAQVMAQCIAPTTPTAAMEVVDRYEVAVVSAGTRSRPHCSWMVNCTWSPAMQTDCARALCQASGYDYEGFLSASNNPCTGTYTEHASYFFVMSYGDIRYEMHTYNAQITARCSGPGSASSSSGPSAVGPGASAAPVACGQTVVDLSGLPVGDQATVDYRVILPTRASYTVYACGSYSGRYLSYVSVFGPLTSTSGAVHRVASSGRWRLPCTDAPFTCERRCQTTEALNLTLGSWSGEAEFLVRIEYQRVGTDLYTPAAFITAAPNPYTCFSYGSGVQHRLQESAACARDGECAEQWIEGAGTRYVRLSCDAYTTSATWTIEQFPYSGCSREVSPIVTRGRGLFSTSTRNSTLYVDCTGNNFANLPVAAATAPRPATSTFTTTSTSTSSTTTDLFGRLDYNVFANYDEDCLQAYNYTTGVGNTSNVTYLYNETTYTLTHRDAVNNSNPYVRCDFSKWWNRIAQHETRYICFSVDGYISRASNHSLWGVGDFYLESVVQTGWPYCGNDPSFTGDCHVSRIVGNATGEKRWASEISWIEDEWFTISMCQEGDTVVFNRTRAGVSTTRPYTTTPRPYTTTPRWWITDRSTSATRYIHTASAAVSGSDEQEVKPSDSSSDVEILHVITNYKGSYLVDEIARYNRRRRARRSDRPGDDGEDMAFMSFFSGADGTGNVAYFRNPWFHVLGGEDPPSTEAPDLVVRAQESNNDSSSGIQFSYQMGLLVLIAVLVILSIAVIFLAYYYDHDDETSVWNKLYIAYVVVFYYAEVWTVFNQAELYFADGLEGVGGAHVAFIVVFWLFSIMSVHRYVRGTELHLSRTVLQGCFLLIPYEAVTLVNNRASADARRRSRLIFDVAVGSSEVLMTIPIAAIQLYSAEKYDGDVFFTVVSVVIACIWNGIASSSYNGRSYAHLKEDFESAGIADKVSTARAEAKGAASESTIWANYLRGGSGWRGLFAYPYFVARVAETVLHVSIFATALLWWTPSIALLYVWRVGVYFGADKLRKDVHQFSYYNRLLMATAYVVTWFDDPRRVSLFEILSGSQKLQHGLGDVVLRDTATAVAAPILRYRHYIAVLLTETLLFAALAGSGMEHDHIDVLQVLAMTLGTAFAVMIVLFHLTWRLSIVSNKFAYKPEETNLLFVDSKVVRKFDTALAVLKRSYINQKPYSGKGTTFGGLQIVATPTSDHIGFVHGHKYTATFGTDFVVTFSTQNGNAFSIHCRHIVGHGFGNNSSDGSKKKAGSRGSAEQYIVAIDFLDIPGMICLQPPNDEECAHVMQTLSDMIQGSITEPPLEAQEAPKVDTISDVPVIPSSMSHRHSIYHLVTLRAVEKHLHIRASAKPGGETEPFVLKLSDLRVFDFRQNGMHRVGLQLTPLRGHGNKIVLSDPTNQAIQALRPALVDSFRECASAKINTDYRFSRLSVECTYLAEYLRLPAVVDVCVSHSMVHLLDADTGTVAHAVALDAIELDRIGELADACTLFLNELPEFLLDCMEGSYLNLTPIFKLGASDGAAQITYEDVATRGLTRTVPITIQEIGFNDTIARETVYSSVGDAWAQDVLAGTGVALRRVKKPKLTMRDVTLASHGDATAVAKLRLHNILIKASSQMLSPVIARAIGRSRTLAECGLHLNPTTGQIQGCILTPGKFTFEIVGKQRIGWFKMTSKQQVVVNVTPRNGVARILYDGMMVNPQSVDRVPTATMRVQVGRRSAMPRVEPALNSLKNEQWFNMRFLRTNTSSALPDRRHDACSLWREVERNAGQKVVALDSAATNNLSIYRDGSIVAHGSAGVRHVEVYAYPGDVSRPLGLHLVKQDPHLDKESGAVPPSDAMVSVYPRLRLHIHVEDTGYTASSSTLPSAAYSNPVYISNPIYEASAPAEGKERGDYLDVHPAPEDDTTAATAQVVPTPTPYVGDVEESFDGFSGMPIPQPVDASASDEALAGFSGLGDDGIDYDE
eukprot:m.1630324 g.1630324  ORF g.1630324 m.1630324 type:complete len:2428 (+) comp25398_c0_seq4:138-7421(+)